jgi:tRNA-splicing ligase RtcB
MIFGKHQQNTLDQFAEFKKSATKAALLSDGHMGVVCPVGSVWAHPSKISLNSIGPDAACGNCAVKTDIKLVDMVEDGVSRVRESRILNLLADNIASTINFGMGSVGCADAPKDHPLFDDPAWNIFPTHIRDSIKARSRNVLTSCGSGNHYLDVFVDTTGVCWVGNHFGSRSYGYNLAKHFMSLGQGNGWEGKHQEIETLLDMNTQLGQDYWELLQLAGKYAYVGREWVARKVVNMIGGNVVDMVHNHHNFAWKEKHDGQELYVSRKGATPAWPHQRGFVGGSMGDNAVILEGAEQLSKTCFLSEPEVEEEFEMIKAQKASLYSTVHGAGRVMSRTEAMGKIDRKTGKLKINKETGEIAKAGKITQEMLDVWMTDADVILRGSGLDEAPMAYRRLPDVLAEQGPTINVLETLKPIIVVMAGANEKDHYHIEG